MNLDNILAHHQQSNNSMRESALVVIVVLIFAFFIIKRAIETVVEIIQYKYVDEVIWELENPDGIVTFVELEDIEE